jgi:predicted RNA-binding Zn ribbon-like protein
MNEIRDAEIHHLIGGELCVDFANTLYGHSGAPIHEYLLDYRDLVLWGRHAGILTEKEARGLLQKAHHRSNEAKAAFHRALALREVIYRLFANLARTRPPKAEDLTALHAAWLKALAHSRLFKTSMGFRLDWKNEYPLDRLLWPIVDSANKLLISEEVQQIKQCKGCDWLFIDRSRNHLRRWCSMKVCGNRAKMRRRHARRKLGMK